MTGETAMTTAERSRRYREANREKVRAATRRWAAANPEKVREYNKANREVYRAGDRRYRERIRTTVFDHYGRSCACCGSADRLSIDHVYGDGGRHRRQIGNGRPASSTELHRWLIAHGFPPGFQVLCHRCNRSKSNGVSCQLAHGSTR